MESNYDDEIKEEKVQNIPEEHFEEISKEHKEFFHYLKKETKIDKDIALTLSTFNDNRKMINGSDEKKEVTLSVIEERLIAKFLTDMIRRNYEWNTKKDLAKEFTIPCCDGSKITLNTKSDFIDDIKLLCILFVTKGGTLEEVSVSSCPQMFSLFSVLMKKYNIIYSTVAGNPDFIYLMKIARSFPFTCCELFSRGVRRQEILNTVLGKALRGRQTAALCPVFPMVATKFLFKKTFNILPHLLWIAHINFISRNRSLNIQPKAISLWSAIKRCLSAAKYLDEKRKFLNCCYWNLIGKDGEANKIWITTRKSCIEYLEKTYSTDESWETVKKELFTDEN